MTGSVSIQVPSYGYTYTFSGVLSIQHEFSLKILTEAESASGTDYVNGARNKPDKIILTVVETDVGKLTGWADRMLQSILRDRLLQCFQYCRKQGFATSDDRQNFENMYVQYHSLGGNGVMDDVRQKFFALPLR